MHSLMSEFSAHNYFNFACCFSFFGSIISIICLKAINSSELFTLSMQLAQDSFTLTRRFCKKQKKNPNPVENCIPSLKRT